MKLTAYGELIFGRPEKNARENERNELLSKAYQALRRQADRGEPYSTHEEAEKVLKEIESCSQFQIMVSRHESNPALNEWFLCPNFPPKKRVPRK